MPRSAAPSAGPRDRKVPSDRSDRERYWSYAEQIGVGAFVAALVILVSLGLARLAGSHPSGTWILEATALIGLGLLILVVSTVHRVRAGQLGRRPRPRPQHQPRPRPQPTSLPASVAPEPVAPVAPEPQPVGPEPVAAQLAVPLPGVEVTWLCHAYTTAAGALLFVLYPTSESVVPARPPARRMGPVACYVLDPNGVGERADDDSISRARDVFTTRWHPSFFPGAPEPVSGEYSYRWDEWHGDDWHLLATGSVWVDYQPAEDA